MRSDQVAFLESQGEWGREVLSIIGKVMPYNDVLTVRMADIVIGQRKRLTEAGLTTPGKRAPVPPEAEANTILPGAHSEE